MPSLKDLRKRITTVTSTRKITKAMQMVAAAKLRRAQDAALAARPFAERMDHVLGNLNKRVNKEGASPLLVGTGKDETYLFIVVTGERGLCGAFNSNVVKAAREQIRLRQSQGKKVQILCVGRKGHDALRSEYGQLVIDTIELRNVRQIGYGNAHEIASRVLKMFGEGSFDVAVLFFSEFKNILTQRPRTLQLIPAQLPEEKAAAGQAAAANADYEFEPDEEQILSDLLPRNVATQIYRALLENNAGFYAAQMTAMDNATRNAGEMIDRLTLKYNRTRQAIITKELIEIISGAEAL
jgi:F-type H+-transporting ATPase subunit gamma